MIFSIYLIYIVLRFDKNIYIKLCIKHTLFFVGALNTDLAIQIEKTLSYQRNRKRLCPLLLKAMTTLLKVYYV